MFNNQFFKILAVCLLLNGSACIGNEETTKTFLDDPFQDQSTEPPVADLVADFDLQATVTKADENDFCDSISASLSDVKPLKIAVADTGECENRETIDAGTSTVTEACNGAEDNVIYQLKSEFELDGCKIENIEIYDVTLQDDGTLSGVYVGFASSSGCVNEDGTDAVSGECNYGGTVVGEVAAVAVDADQDGFNTDTDCDDTDATINPDAVEIVDNGVDEDCSGADLTTAECTATSTTDIPDNDIDDDCDGTVDEVDIVDGCDLGDTSCDADSDGLCDVADQCDGNAIDPDATVANTWYWVDSELGITTGAGGFADYSFVDGTKDGSGTIFVFGVVEGFLEQTTTYSFCAGTVQSTMTGICITE